MSLSSLLLIVYSCGEKGVLIFFERPRFNDFFFLLLILIGLQVPASLLGWGKMGFST